MIDLDGTLIGKIGSVVCEYDLVNLLGGKAAMKGFKERLISRLRYGIIRPHVHAFCKWVASGNANVEMFIYTASDTYWASIIVPCVEAALGVKFNRPILSRVHCLQPDLTKSISRVTPLVFSRLKKKYRMSSIGDLNDRILLVDNTPTVLADPMEQLVVCPTYSYDYVYDVLSRVEIDTMHRKFSKVMPVLTRYGMFPVGRTVASYQEFAAIYYERLAKMIGDSRQSNSTLLQTDHFWTRMLQALMSQRSQRFDNDGVRYIKHKVQ